MSSKKMIKATQAEIGELAPQIHTAEVSTCGISTEVKEGISRKIREAVDADVKLDYLIVKQDSEKRAITTRKELVYLRQIPVILFVGSRSQKNSDVALLHRYANAVIRRHWSKIDKKFVYRNDERLKVLVRFSVIDQSRVEVLAASLPSASKEYMMERMKKEAEFDAAEAQRVKEQAESKSVKKAREEKAKLEKERARREADQQKKLEREAAKAREERRKELVRIAREQAKGQR